jgi:formylglycine-generating enzyme required for sulfatase activity
MSISKIMILMLFSFGILFSRNVQVTNVFISNINGEFATINYDLQRTNPAISSEQPVWIFVKYRLANETDFTGWKDTDDPDATNDASDTNTDVRAASVNANLSGDVGIVTSAGTKSINWHWGGLGSIQYGTGLSSAQSVRIRVYAIEMAFIAGGNINFRQDPGYTASSLTGTTTKCGSDYYIMKYPVTARMYKDFLNAAANRHDNYLAPDSVHDYFTQTSYHGQQDDLNNTIRNMLFSLDSFYGLYTIIGTVGVNAQWDIYDEDGNGIHRARYPITHLTWYNCYDFSAWCGLSLLEEEHYYKVNSENGQSIFSWGNTDPTTDLCNFDNVIHHPTDVTDYEAAVDATDGGQLYQVYELTGNVWEWTSTGGGHGNYIGSTTYDPNYGPLNYNTTDTYVIKKTGRWFSDINHVASAYRYFGLLRIRYTPSGFRLGYFGGN